MAVRKTGLGEQKYVILKRMSPGVMWVVNILVKVNETDKGAQITIKPVT